MRKTINLGHKIKDLFCKNMLWDDFPWNVYYFRSMRVILISLHHHSWALHQLAFIINNHSLLDLHNLNCNHYKNQGPMKKIQCWYLAYLPAGIKFHSCLFVVIPMKTLVYTVEQLNFFIHASKAIFFTACDLVFVDIV